MNAAEVEAKRKAGLLLESHDKIGFFLTAMPFASDPEPNDAFGESGPYRRCIWHSIQCVGLHSIRHAVFREHKRPILIHGERTRCGERLRQFGARFFGSTTGRFMSPDPLKITDERVHEPALTNLYEYGGNNPLKFVDPDGRDITYFYDQGGLAGHAVLFAYNQANG